MLNSGYIPRRVFRNRVSGGSNSVSLLIVFNHQILAHVSAVDYVEAASPVLEVFAISDEWYNLVLDNILEKWNFDYEIHWVGYAPIINYISQ
jgi:hypothetical protein